MLVSAVVWPFMLLLPMRSQLRLMRNHPCDRVHNIGQSTLRNKKHGSQYYYNGIPVNQAAIRGMYKTSYIYFTLH